MSARGMFFGKSHAAGGSKRPAATQPAPEAKLRRVASKNGPPVPTLPGWAPARTPLEEQFIRVKAGLEDSIVLVEVGYKFSIFGRDAEVAAPVFGYFVNHSEGKAWKQCSFPVTRLKINTARLVNLGYRVAHLTQGETAAIREEEGKTGEFQRVVSGLFSPATMILNEDSGGEGGPPDDSPHYLMIVTEQALMPAEKEENLGHDVRISLTAVSLATGSAIIWDSFTDGPLRREFTTRLLKLDPVEVLVPKSLSPLTLNIVLSLGVNRGVPPGAEPDPEYKPTGRVRLEKKPDKDFEKAKQGGAVKALLDGADRGQSELPVGVMSCVGILVHHLETYKLQELLLRRADSGSLFERYSGSGYMTLPGTTIANLEVFNVAERAFAPSSALTNRVPGSLNWVINHCRTGFGARLMRQWLCRPLTSREAIADRQDAVAELLGTDRVHVFYDKTLSSMPDLERMLTKANYGKAQPKELMRLLQALRRLCSQLRDFTGCTEDGVDAKTGLSGAASEINAASLKEVFEGVPVGTMEASISTVLGRFCHEAAKTNNSAELFSGDMSSGFPELEELKKSVTDDEEKLRSHLGEVRKTLRLLGLTYKTISGVEYLLDVPTANLRNVPKDWTEISRVKASVRYHSPLCVSATRTMRAARDKLEIASRRCWEQLQTDFAKCIHGPLRSLITQLATLDCFFSLAAVGREEGWVRPEVVEEHVVDIVDGRHPVLDKLLREQEKQYVPNSAQIRAVDGEQIMIVTGPNMGGKSSYLRQVALAVLLSQIGSWVPATSARLGVFDAIFVRLGAEDSLSKGQSTFMVEMTETSDILRRATDRSLVVLDELGRGTSTFDGVAIAYAVLEHLIHHLRCLTLFVTHYPSISDLSAVYRTQVRAFHMSFGKKDGQGSNQSVSFLYKLTAGVSPSSFGLNVARLAGVPSGVLEEAARRAEVMEAKQTEATQANGALISYPAAGRIARELMQVCDGTQPDNLQNLFKWINIDALVR